MTKEEIKAKFAKEIDDAELDEVAGGSLNDSADDLFKLFAMGESGKADAEQIAKDNILDTADNQLKFQRELKAAFLARGIRVDYSLDDPNVYSDGIRTTDAKIGNGKSVVSREEFWKKIFETRHFE